MNPTKRRKRVMSKHCTFMGYYYTEEQGQLVTLSNAFTEQEAFAA